MDTNKYYQERVKEGHSYKKCRLHYCNDWDGLPVCKHSPEMEACLCRFEEMQVANEPHRNQS